jgi:hypothetical protein
MRREKKAEGVEGLICILNVYTGEKDKGRQTDAAAMSMRMRLYILARPPSAATIEGRVEVPSGCFHIGSINTLAEKLNA